MAENPGNRDDIQSNSRDNGPEGGQNGPQDPPEPQEPTNGGGSSPDRTNDQEQQQTTASPGGPNRDGQEDGQNQNGPQNPPQEPTSDGATTPDRTNGEEQHQTTTNNGEPNRDEQQRENAPTRSEGGDTLGNPPPASPSPEAPLTDETPGSNRDGPQFRSDDASPGTDLFGNPIDENNGGPPPREPADPPREPADPPREPNGPPREPIDPPREPANPPREPADPPREPEDPPREPANPPREPADPRREPEDPRGPPAESTGRPLPDPTSETNPPRPSQTTAATDPGVGHNDLNIPGLPVVTDLPDLVDIVRPIENENRPEETPSQPVNGPGNGNGPDTPPPREEEEVTPPTTGGNSPTTIETVVDNLEDILENPLRPVTPPTLPEPQPVNPPQSQPEQPSRPLSPTIDRRPVSLPALVEQIVQPIVNGEPSGQQPQPAPEVPVSESQETPQTPSGSIPPINDIVQPVLDGLSSGANALPEIHTPVDPFTGLAMPEEQNRDYASFAEQVPPLEDAISASLNRQPGFFNDAGRPRGDIIGLAIGSNPTGNLLTTSGSVLEGSEAVLGKNTDPETLPSFTRPDGIGETTTNQAASMDDTKKSSGPAIGLIAGIVVAGVCLILLFGFVIRKARKSAKPVKKEKDVEAFFEESHVSSLPPPPLEDRVHSEFEPFEDERIARLSPIRTEIPEASMLPPPAPAAAILPEPVEVLVIDASPVENKQMQLPLPAASNETIYSFVPTNPNPVPLAPMPQTRLSSPNSSLGWSKEDTRSEVSNWTVDDRSNPSDTLAKRHKSIFYSSDASEFISRANTVEREGIPSISSDPSQNSQSTIDQNKGRNTFTMSAYFAQSERNSMSMDNMLTQESTASNEFSLLNLDKMNRLASFNPPRHSSAMSEYADELS